jgi:hypothetical protein
MAGDIVVPGLPKNRYSDSDLKDAAEDARNITAESKIVQACISVDIASRQLYMLARQVMDQHIQDEWDVQNGELVVQTLVMAAQERSVQPATATELRSTILEFVVPFLNIMVDIEKEAAKAAAQTDNGK